MITLVQPDYFFYGQLNNVNTTFLRKNIGSFFQSSKDKFNGINNNDNPLILQPLIIQFLQYHITVIRHFHDFDNEISGPFPYFRILLPTQSYQTPTHMLPGYFNFGDKHYFVDVLIYLKCFENYFFIFAHV